MKSRFDLLDGLRGISAIAVMTYHFTQHNGLHWLKGGSIAVDLFFILSGFIIAHSYFDRITGGMTFLAFIWRRFVRLYPMYFIGLLLGIFAMLSPLIFGAPLIVNSNNLVGSIVLGILGFPYLNNTGWPFGSEIIFGSLYPFDGPAWSLFFEFFVNVIYYIYLSKFGRNPPNPLLITTIICYGLIVILLKNDNPGWGIQSFIYGFPRVISEFFLGCALYQFSNRRLVVNKFLPILLIPILLTGFFMEGFQRALIWSFIIAPIVIVLLSRIEISGFCQRICKILGEISYPLYIIHLPIFLLIFEFSNLHSYSLKAQLISLVSVTLIITVVFIYLDNWIRGALLKLDLV
ncbi:acyltransferase family protein [Sapientia aquatica]|uniref:Acyltransferase n=1 Tax=Sapientia aquatica TaxID=1549640 RepID=A0A4R5W2F2_9BURK|nr:acyltransferase [Sapientia aquatica]TDK66523.1 acyltransferase [Sapientia aquatica]